MASDSPQQPDMLLPSVQVVTASAGSGKTRALTQRLLALILADGFTEKDLRRILAVTFTNHAAMEMRHRILGHLKSICLGRKHDFVPSFRKPMAKAETKKRACQRIDTILDHYSDLQIRTIDSFMASVFKASAVEFGFSPDAEIQLDSGRILDRVFDQWARELEDDDARAEFVQGVLESVETTRDDKASYQWNPYIRIRERVKELYTLIGRYSEPLVFPGRQVEMQNLKKEIVRSAKALWEDASAHPKMVDHHFRSDLALLRAGQVNSVMGRTPRVKFVNKEAQIRREYSEWAMQLQHRGELLMDQLRHYARLFAGQFFEPFATLIDRLDDRIAAASRERSEVYLGDVHRRLARHLERDDVPDMYQRLGDQILHFLIDEFQDTAPIHWTNLRLLIENALATGGSLFVVGDTKQSIYSFNGADWRIMRGLETRNEFPSSALYERLTLETNYRSDGVLVNFCKKVFKERLEDHLPGNDSGLTTFEQETREGRHDLGYVTVTRIHPDEETSPEQDHVLRVIAELRDRKYRWKDIAILTGDNYTVVRISSWLNEAGFPFISHSSLDVRRRKFTGEIVALLRFLNSPIDDLAFATFIAGNLFRSYLGRFHPDIPEDMALSIVRQSRIENRRGLLYKQFQQAHPELWSACFEEMLHQVGYLPLYDLACQIFGRFRVFEVAKGEEAAAAKLLEIFKDFEQTENNSLKDFLDPAFEDRVEWEIQVPTGTDAIHVMTTHKSKGLGFPAVIVVQDVRSPSVKTPAIVEVDNGITLRHIKKGLEKWDPDVEAAREAEAHRLKVDAFNRLYVALTRAQHEMHVLVTGKGSFMSAAFPEEHEVYGRPTEGHGQPDEDDEAPMLHTSGGTIADSGEWHAASVGARRRGDRIHALFQGLVWLDGNLDELVREASREIEGITTEEIRIVEEFLGHKGIRPYFEKQEGRRVLTEQEIVRADGQLFRIDRLVIDPDVVTVIDFKTSTEDRPEYSEQVRNYLNILRPFYPDRRMAGILAYVDRGLIREVR